MGKGLCYHRGRWVPRGRLYDFGEEPVLIGPARPRRRGGAGGGKLAPVEATIGLLLALLGGAAVGSLYGFIAFKLLVP
jgi:hypothetical protein